MRAACSIAKYTAEDECAGLADLKQLAKDPPDLDLHHPWNLSAEVATAMARECEDAARGVDRRIKNSEGATVSSYDGLEVYGNTNGFLGAIPASRQSLSCSVIAQDDAGMQRDYWYSVARDASDLQTPEQVGTIAGHRALRRLGARQPGTRETPVVYEAPVASTLLSHFVGAVRGSSLYRQASFLLDHVGKQVFSDWVRIVEQPHLPKAIDRKSVV